MYGCVMYVQTKKQNYVTKITRDPPPPLLPHIPGTLDASLRVIHTYWGGIVVVVVAVVVCIVVMVSAVDRPTATAFGSYCCCGCCGCCCCFLVALCPF